MSHRFLSTLLPILATMTTVFAQGGLEPAPAAPTQSQAAPANSNAAPEKSNAGNSSFLGKDMPMFNPGSEIVTWDGKNWNINNNRLFEARFEKYLSAPAADSEAYKAYQAILEQIMDKLAPTSVTPKSTDEAFQLLAKASEYPGDANLCDAIAYQVYSSWLAKNNMDRMRAANEGLEKEKKRLEWNAMMTAEGSALEGPSSKGAEAAQQWKKQVQLKRDMEMQPLITRLAEVQALLKTNQLKREVAALQIKIEFQALIVQHFFQRRFQHAIIGTRFYRNVFADGDSQLRVGEDAKSLFAKTTGLPPTMGTVDSLANEVIRDVQEGVQSFKFLLDQDELQSASKRLAEAFILGEYLPQIRTLDRKDKRRALAFVQKSNQLISAIEVKDYTLAEKLVAEINESAKDTDTSKPTAAIETARQVSAMHIAKARNAAVSGDKNTLETELKAATEIWPRNPALSEVSSMIFQQADEQSRALVDFDQLLSQKNHRQIFDDKMRFIAATAMYPEKQEELSQVLDEVQVIETAIIQAQEIEKQGDQAGAWESAERTFRNFPNDNKLNQLRANLTIQAAAFVQAIQQAEKLENNDQPGSSLAWYLKALHKYPQSQFAHDGIDRLTKKILPDAT